MNHAVESSRPLIEAAGHRFTVQLPQDLPEVEVDVTRMSQALLKLLNNAAKYTPAGGRIDLAVSRVGGEVLMAVSDTGVGIPAPMLPKVFEMFAQVDRGLDRTQGGA